MQSAFSKRQIDIFRNVMVTRDGNPTSGPGLAKCRHCVGSQSVELTCTVCDRTKGLEDFAKSQRANRDNAVCDMSRSFRRPFYRLTWLKRCLACVQRLGLVDPVIEGRKLLMENARKGDTMGMRVSPGYSLIQNELLTIGKTRKMKSPSAIFRK